MLLLSQGGLLLPQRNLVSCHSSALSSVPSRCRSAFGKSRHSSPGSQQQQQHCRQDRVIKQQLHVCRALFPGKQAQSRVQLPALMLSVTASDIVDAAAPHGKGGSVSEQVSKAVGAGATAVILRDPDSGSAGTLYEAAVKLKSLLRGRAALLLVDRTDIVQAADADGVLLTDNGWWFPDTRSSFSHTHTHTHTHTPGDILRRC